MNSQSISSWLVILATSINIPVVQGILNGNIAVGDKFTYQVFLKGDDDDDLLKSCGGVILDEWHILTAAHCVYNMPIYEITVYAGTYRLEVDDVVIRDVTKVHLPKDFVLGREEADDRLKGKKLSSRDENDIAILTLNEPLTLGKRIRAIPLPTTDISCPKMCELSGWGVTAIDSSEESQDLLWYEAIILGPSLCRESGSAHRDNEFCALDPLRKSTPLKGDSGGGLVCDGVLVGILSTGTGHVDIPAIYVNVYSFLTFINDTIGKKDQEEEEPMKKKRKIERTSN